MGQFHAQSEMGEHGYGYVNGESSKQEFKTADGIVQGTYSYVDANGILQTVNYISDAEGFKVAATNLPKAPVADVVAKTAPDVAPTAYVAPAPVIAAATDDMEVVAAKEIPLVGPTPYVINPYAYHYAPQQGYYQAPYTPAVVQAPVHPQTA